jgi:hypothetical protein
MAETVSVLLRVSPELISDIDVICVREGRTRSDVLRRMLTAAVRDDMGVREDVISDRPSMTALRQMAAGTRPSDPSSSAALAVAPVISEKIVSDIEWGVDRRGKPEFTGQVDADGNPMSDEPS